jgi:hypothetical protein
VSGQISPLANAYTQPNLPDVGFGFNGWQLVIALTSYLAGVEPINVYFRTIPIIAFLKIISMYVFGSIFFNNQNLGLATAIVFLLDVGLYHAGGTNLFTSYPTSSNFVDFYEYS